MALVSTALKKFISLSEINKENLGIFKVLPQDLFIHILSFISMQDFFMWMMTGASMYQTIKTQLANKLTDLLIAKYNQKKPDLKQKTVEELKQIYLSNLKGALREDIYFSIPRRLNPKYVCLIR